MKKDLAGLGSWEESGEQQRGIEGVVKSGGYGSEGEVDTQYRCQPQPDFRGKEESNNIIRT